MVADIPRVITGDLAFNLRPKFERDAARLAMKLRC
jgi:hypothetical protein